MCLENRPRRSEKVYYHGDNGSLGCVDWIHGWSEAGIFLLPWWLETIMLGTEIQIGNSGWLLRMVGSLLERPISALTGISGKDRTPEGVITRRPARARSDVWGILALSRGP